MLLGPQHEPEPILKALFTRDETVISEPDEKKTKREKPQLKPDEVERALANVSNLSRDFLMSEVFPVIMKHIETGNEPPSSILTHARRNFKIYLLSIS